jgi:hypothetical protein
MNINWKEVKEKYIHVYTDFIKFYIDQCPVLYECIRFNEEDLDCVCFCEIEKFFENLGYLKQYLRLLHIELSVFINLKYDDYLKIKVKVIMTIFAKIENELNKIY